MKWTIGEEPSASEPGPTDRSAIAVEIPDKLRSVKPRVGEAFEATVTSTDSNGTIRSKVLTCRFVGDGLSLLVGQRMVRITRQPWALKKGKHRVRAGCGGIVADHELFLERMRPVQPKKAEQGSNCGDVAAPLTGKVIKIALAEGEAVKEGDILIIVEAMKMENQIRSESDGFVAKVHVRAGDAVKVGDVLLTLCPQPPEVRSSQK
jgi:acetyl/propionyl-CoA carboxylase alpha subunit